MDIVCAFDDDDVIVNEVIRYQVIYVACAHTRYIITFLQCICPIDTFGLYYGCHLHSIRPYYILLLAAFIHVPFDLSYSILCFRYCASSQLIIALKNRQNNVLCNGFVKESTIFLFVGQCSTVLISPCLIFSVTGKY